jgi:hypothetical protein
LLKLLILERYQTINAIFAALYTRRGHGEAYEIGKKINLHAILGNWPGADGWNASG